MGIYDREYYRDDARGPGLFNGVNPACKTIILINVVVFLAQWLNPEWGRGDSAFREAFEASSDGILRHFKVWQLLTATFLHDPNNLFHILWNMLFLWVVGREMEAMYGSREFTALYLCAAVFSTLCWAIVDRFFPGAKETRMIGASGAVMAIVVLYTLYYPRREVLLFFVLPVETWLLLVVFLGYDALNLVRELQVGRSLDGSSKAFASHLGGALYGYMYKTFDLRIMHVLDRRNRRPRLRVVSPEPRERDRERPAHQPAATSRSAGATSGARGSGASVVSEEQLNARLDEVLAKIAREGRSKLTDEENTILQEASRRARDRRSDRV